MVLSVSVLKNFRVHSFSVKNLTIPALMYIGNTSVYVEELVVV